LNNHPVYIGADVCKARVDLHCSLIKLPAFIGNNARGFKTLINLIKKGPNEQPVWLICEATGPYHKALSQALADEQIIHSVVNPRQVRDFARAANRLAKTDPLDARLLALYGERMQPAPTQPSSESQLQLEAFAARRRQLVEMRSEEIKRLPQTQDKRAKASIKSSITFLDKQIAAFDQRLEECAKNDELMSRKVELFCKVQGVGMTTALLLLAAAPELGKLAKNKIAALAGLAPFDNQSGSKKGQKSISGGRLSIRAALYMAALSAARHNDVLKPFYQNLRANGKSFKVAVTAVMRKLLIHLNTLARSVEANSSPQTPAAASGAGCLRGGISPSSDQ